MMIIASFMEEDYNHGELDQYGRTKMWMTGVSHHGVIEGFQ